MFDYKLLSALAAVVEQAGFERAAQVLGLSQSAISQRIKLLEALIGQPVLVRATPPSPTEIGRRLLNHVQQVRLLERDLQSAVPALDEDGLPERLRIALNADSLATWWAQAVGDFCAEQHLLLIAILALTAACSSTKEVVDENLSEVELYQQAQADLDNHSYTSATAKLKALESRYPFGRYADQAQLELIYAYYKNSEPEAAKSAAERFIRLHPQHPNVDYAYYLKGLTSFDQDVGLLARFLPLDMTKRDPGAARDSYNEFAQLTSRFPNSRYAPDAKQRMIYLRNLLAAYEIHVADYYLTRQAYVASANRGRYVVENFQETPSVGDGLAVMVESYQRMHLDQLASTSLEVLKANYPDHPSLVDGQFVPQTSESDSRSWLSKATLGLIESSTPLPPGETRANMDIQKQYQDAKDAIPAELKPKDADGEVIPEPEAEGKSRSWFSYMTLGLFD